MADITNTIVFNYLHSYFILCGYSKSTILDNIKMVLL